MREPPLDQQRWDEIEALLQAVLDLDPAERPAFLEQACRGDEALRREVETLLAGEADGEHFIERPALAGISGDAADPSTRLLAGERVGHYRIESFIGAGGMGQVYSARDEHLPRVVALKMLPAAFTSDAGRVWRFEQEARAASALNHPNIITIFEVLRGDPNDPRSAHFIVTEYVEGRTLRDLLTNPETKQPRRLAAEQALDICTQVAGALQAAHTAWIIHRDIKPENIMVRSDGLVKVLDFGIAKLTGEAQDALRSDPGGEETVSPNRTSAGMILGTASYMSPEQARCEPLDGRTDLFSLGATLYEMVTGRRLLPGSTRAEALQTFEARAELVPADTRIDHVPKKLERIARTMVRARREERYASAEALLADLTGLKRRLESRTSRRVAKLGALALALAVALVAAAAALSITESWEERVFRDGHTAAVRQAVFSPDGRLLVSVGEDSRVIVWDFARRERVATLTDHRDWVHSVSFSPDGKWFATGSNDHTVIVWDAVRLTRAAVLREHRAPVYAVAISPDGLLLASSAAGPLGGNTIVREVKRWQVVRELPQGLGHGPTIFSPESRRLLLNASEWDIATGERLPSSNELVGWNWAAFSPDGRQLIYTSPTGAITFLELREKGTLVGCRIAARRQAHQDFGRAVVFSPDGKLAASGSENIVLWDVATRTKLGRFEYDAIVWGLSFSPDGRWLVSTHGDGAVLVWNIDERRREASLNGHSDAVRTVAFSPDGSRFASAGEDRSVIVWNASSGAKEAVLNGHRTRVVGAAFSPDGKWLASADQDSFVIRWDLEAKAARWHIPGSSIGAKNVCMGISPNGRWLATRQGIFDTATGEQILDLTVGTRINGLEGVDFSPDSRRLACVTQSWVTILDTETWQIVEQQESGSSPIVSVRFSPDGRSLVTGNIEGTILPWKAAPLEPIATLGRHTARVKALAFSPDGETVVSSGDDKMIALWDVDRRKLRTRIGTHATPVYTIAFSPDGRQIASGEHDRSVRLYTRLRTLWGRRLDGVR